VQAPCLHVRGAGVPLGALFPIFSFSCLSWRRSLSLVSNASRITPHPAHEDAHRPTTPAHTHARRYKITEYQAPNLVQFVGESDSVKAVDTIRFTATDAGHTHIDYKADLSLKGFRRPFIALISSALDQLGKDAMNGLTRRLNKGLPKL
jgi:hypothetical protein